MTKSIADIIDLKNEIIQLSGLIAAAALKQQKPVADEISTRTAYRDFGREWIEYHTHRRTLSVKRNGPHPNSPKVYSRMECLALKEAERRGAQIINKD